MAISKIKTKSLALSSVNSDIILNNTVKFINLDSEVSNAILNTKTSVQDTSANWDTAYTNLVTNSAAYLSGYDLTFLSVSSNWNSTYTTVQTNSSSWDYQGTDLKDLSANWQSTYSTVQSNSADWSNAYTNLITNSAAYLSGYDLSFLSVSSNWDSNYTTVQSNSATNWNNDLVTSFVWNNFIPLSGGTITGSLSVIGDVTYFDTSVQVTSAMYIDTVSTEAALRITQRGFGDVIRVEDETNPDSTPFIINADGLVGVGTAIPNQKLTVIGNVSATGSYYGDGSKLTGIVAGDSVATTLVRSNSANWNSVFTTVQSNSATYIITGGNSVSSNVVVGTNDAFNLDLETNNVSRMTILSSGNIGVGISNPNEKLTVSGSISATGIISASASNIRVNVVNTTTSRTFSDSDSNKIFHFNTSLSSVSASFPTSLSNGFNAVIMNTGTNSLIISAANLNSAGTTIATRFGGAFVYKDSDNVFAVGRLT